MLPGVCNKIFYGADFRAPNSALVLKPAQWRLKTTPPRKARMRSATHVNVQLYMASSLADAGNKYFGASKSRRGAALSTMVPVAHPWLHSHNWGT